LTNFTQHQNIHKKNHQSLNFLYLFQERTEQIQLTDVYLFCTPLTFAHHQVRSEEFPSAWRQERDQYYIHVKANHRHCCILKLLFNLHEYFADGTYHLNSSPQYCPRKLPTELSPELSSISRSLQIADNSCLSCVILKISITVRARS